MRAMDGFSLVLPGDPAEAWDVLVAVPRWLMSGPCFWGEQWDLLPSRDGECVAQLGERRDGSPVAPSCRVLTQPLWLRA